MPTRAKSIALPCCKTTGCSANFSCCTERTDIYELSNLPQVFGDMQVTAYRAGHVLGACMFEVEIAGMRLLYTGDYSRVPDRHLSAADTPDNPPHIGEVCQACRMY